MRLSGLPVSIWGWKGQVRVHRWGAGGGVNRVKFQGQESMMV